MPRFKGSPLLYQAAHDFADRCLVQDLSLIWPTVPVWRPEHLRLITERFVVSEAPDDRSFEAKLAEQFGPLPPPCWRLLADALYVYLLPSSFFKDKYGFLAALVRSHIPGFPEATDPVWAPLEKGFTRTGLHYHLKFPQLRLLFLFAQEIKQTVRQRQALVTSQTAVEGLLDRITAETGPPRYRGTDMRHALLHMMFPDSYEQIISTRDKEWIVEKYRQHLPSSLKDADRDVQLKALRSYFEGLPQYRDGFDFWSLKNEWRPAKVKDNEDKEEEEKRPGGDHASHASSRAWIFQSNPERYAIRRALAALREQTWTVARYKDEIAAGDRVYIWESGTPGGIIAVGSVRGRAEIMSSPPEEDQFILDEKKFEREQLRVIVENIEVLSSPLSKEEIRSVPDLRGLAVLAQPQGTNYRLTPDEAGRMARLVSQRRGALTPPQKPTVATPAKLTLEWLADQTLWSKERLEEISEALKGGSPQIVLAGPPGTSKTWVAKHLATYVTEGIPGTVRIVQFHPSYTYEQFMQGLRPVVEDRAVQFRLVNGVVLEAARDALARGGDHVILIDEMNRANLSQVLGELMYLFEYRDQPISLQYSSQFSLPTNLRFLGTMNTADRSIRSIDSALRRRFDIFECKPDVEILGRYYTMHDNAIPDLFAGFEKLNDLLSQKLDRHHLIGHTFFMADPMTPAKLRHTWNHRIRPLIEEYFFDQQDVAALFELRGFWSLGE